MNKNFKYEIINSNGCIRWENRKSFLKKEEFIRKKKNNKVGIICLFYSSFDNIKKIYSYIELEKNQKNFDLILINNSGNDQDFLHEFKNDNVIILTPIANLGTDGGYSLGLEYGISKGYDYLFLIEDDVILLDKNAFSDLLEKMDLMSVGFITPKVNDYDWEGSHSWIVQFACYSTDFLKKCGVLEPRFFTRGGDGLWFPQVESTIKKFGYKKILINKKHFHPYLKKGNRSARWIYFIWRNLFLWNDDGYLNYFKLFLYILNGFIKFIEEKNSFVLKGIFLGLYDYLFNGINLDTSLSRMEYLSRIKKSNHYDEVILTHENIKKVSSNFFGVGFSSFDSCNMNLTDRLFKSKGIIIPNIQSPYYLLTLLFSKAVIVNDISYGDNVYLYSVTEITRTIKDKIVYFILLLIFGVISLIIVLLVLAIIVIFGKYKRKKFFYSSHN